MNLLKYIKENKRNVIVVILVSLVVLVLGFVILNLIIRSHPNNHNEQLYGVIRVGYANTTEVGPWTESELEVLQKSMTEASRLGPTFVVSNEAADIIIWKTDNVCGRDGAGSFITDIATGNKRIDINNRCIHSSLELQSALVHEVGHFVGMGHVCRPNQNGAECSVVGKGDAVLNTGLIEEEVEREGAGFNHAYVGSVPVWNITELDVLEFKRVWTLRGGRRY